jgi:hypothetical protein
MSRARPLHLRLVRPVRDLAPTPIELEALQIEKEILAFVEQAKAQVLETAARMIADRPEPVDPVEARLLLSELRSGSLP